MSLELPQKYKDFIHGTQLDIKLIFDKISDIKLPVSDKDASMIIEYIDYCANKLQIIANMINSLKAQEVDEYDYEGGDI